MHDIELEVEMVMVMETFEGTEKETDFTGFRDLRLRAVWLWPVRSKSVRSGCVPFNSTSTCPGIFSYIPLLSFLLLCFRDCVLYVTCTYLVFI